MCLPPSIPGGDLLWLTRVVLSLGAEGTVIPLRWFSGCWMLSLSSFYRQTMETNGKALFSVMISQVFIDSIYSPGWGCKCFPHKHRRWAKIPRPHSPLPLRRRQVWKHESVNQVMPKWEMDRQMPGNSLASEKSCLQSKMENPWEPTRVIFWPPQVSHEYACLPPKCTHRHMHTLNKWVLIARELELRSSLSQRPMNRERNHIFTLLFIRRACNLRREQANTLKTALHFIHSQETCPQVQSFQSVKLAINTDY